MEVVNVSEERRGCREMSSSGDHRSKLQGKIMRPAFKKVEVVYYLSRNGNLEHPHYIQVTHLAHQHLRLKDFMDRLAVLRGKGMPSLYSWSCKRSYKNGYVWNDLAENDVIYPSEGAEYVLKGSELIQPCTEKLHHLQVISNVQHGNNQQVAGQDSILQPKRRSLASKRRPPEPEEMVNSHDGEYEEIGEPPEQEYEEKMSYSRGVSTDEIQECNKQEKKGPSDQLSLDSNSPPSPTSSTLSDKPTNSNNNNNNNDNNEPPQSKNSMLLNLIVCGGSASFRKIVPPPSSLLAKNSGGGTGGGSLHKGVVGKKAVEEEEEMIAGCMPENPRFGNLQAEGKEYFSGSIVEAMKNERVKVVELDGLKKSSSHNEERSNKIGMGEEAEEEMREDNEVKGKCIPMKKTSTKQSKK